MVIYKVKGILNNYYYVVKCRMYYICFKYVVFFFNIGKCYFFNWNLEFFFDNCIVNS